MRKARDVWRLQEKWGEVKDVLLITNTRQCTCFTIDKFTREFNFDTLYLYKITRHLDFKSISTPTKLLSKLPRTSEGFNISAPFRSFHVHFNALHKAKSLTRRMTVRPCRNALRYDGLNHVKGEGKAVPLQAWSGPQGSSKLRFPDFMTTAQDGGKFVNLTHRPPLPPGNTPGTHFC